MGSRMECPIDENNDEMNATSQKKYQKSETIMGKQI